MAKKGGQRRGGRNQRPEPRRPAAPRDRPYVWAAGGLLVLAGLAVYCNSFQGQFFLDDHRLIVANPQVGRFWPIWGPGRGSRIVVGWSLALNHRLGGLNPWGYHALNVAAHLLAGLTLFGIVRRTLIGQRLRQHLGRAGLPLAALAALIWTVHPLQTAAVTYVIQRAEVLMGLFYLLTLYCAIRGFGSPRPGPWQAAAVAACAVGMGAKPVMVTAPVMVLLYDRLLVSGSFRTAIGRRWKLYASLAGTWLILAVLIWPQPVPKTAGFAMEAMTPLEYARTQFGVIVHYLKLSAWPVSQCFDYAWPVARSAGEIAAPAAVVAALLAATALALWRQPALGFLGAWFFVILAPTSSFVPIGDALFEHRMYLPLAAVVVLAVAGGHALVRRLGGGRRGQVLAGGLAAAVAVALGCLTVRRNFDYYSREGMWRDVVAKRPANGRAHLNLGLILAEQGRMAEAAKSYRRALDAWPDHPRACSYYGQAIFATGQHAEGMEWMLKAAGLAPDDPVVNNALGMAYHEQGEPEKAERHFRRVVRALPGLAEAHANLGAALAARKGIDEAIRQLKEAVRLKPDWPEGRYQLGSLLLQLGRHEEAAGPLTESLALRPDYAEAHSKLGLLLTARRRHEAALKHLGRAVALKPDLAEAQYGLGVALSSAGRAGEAAEHVRAALRMDSRPPYTMNNLAWLLATSPDEAVRNGTEAVRLAERACRTAGGRQPRFLDTLAAAYAEAGRFDRAVETIRQAIELAEGARMSETAQEFRSRLRLYRSRQPFRANAP